jgi:uncharacterized protein (DUF2141 family)
MHRRRVWQLTILGLILAMPVFGQALSGDIVVEVQGLRNDKGLVRVTLYDSPPGFPNDLSKALDAKAVEIDAGYARVVFPRYSHGTYAVGLFHDENRNGVMDTNLIGVPREGYGASQDARGRLGPPRFQDAAFEHDGRETVVRVTMEY